MAELHIVLHTSRVLCRGFEPFEPSGAQVARFVGLSDVVVANRRRDQIFFASTEP